MKVKFWGTRGSLPQALSHNDVLAAIESSLDEAGRRGISDLTSYRSALKNGQSGNPLSYGGNTTCTEILHGDQSLFVDMGSGFREAGTHAMSQGRKEFVIFLTHMHWDHIMGMPFFVPIHVPGHKLVVYHVHKNAPEFVKINFNGINFPLTWEQLGGKVEFRQLKIYEVTTLGDVTVTPFVLDHPGGSFGYRFEAGGKSVAIGVDGEYKRTSAKELGKDLRYFQNLDLLIFDAQYEMSELASRFDWGHCCPNIGVDLALREGIKMLAFTHHDPWANPSKLRRMYENARTHLNAQLPAYADQWAVRQPGGPRILTAYDGLVLDLDSL